MRIGILRVAHRHPAVGLYGEGHVVPRGTTGGGPARTVYALPGRLAVTRWVARDRYQWRRQVSGIRPCRARRKWPGRVVWALPLAVPAARGAACVTRLGCG